MNSSLRPVGPAKSSVRAVMLVTVMLLASLGPILTVPVASAHEGTNGTIWPMEGPKTPVGCFSMQQVRMRLTAHRLVQNG